MHDGVRQLLAAQEYVSVSFAAACLHHPDHFERGSTPMNFVPAISVDRVSNPLTAVCQ